MELKHSKYNITVSNQDYYLIFNTATSACVVFNANEYNDFISTNFKAVSIKRLQELGILLPSDFDEVKEFLTFAERKRNATDTLFYRILVTTYCNAHCEYCYEKNFAQITMTRPTSIKVVEFIKKEANNKRSVVIQWFGGEPLLNITEIDFICKQLKNYCDQHGKSFKSAIVTNGLLFFKEDIRGGLKTWNIDRVQITLDGLKHYFESVKKYSIANSFEIILSNIKFLIGNNIKVSIRLNYSEQNIHEIVDLIKFLNNEFPNKTNLYVYAQQLFNEKTSLNDNINLGLTISVLDILYENGFLDNVFNRLGVSFGCFASKEDNFTIMPDGSLYKCSLEATLKRDNKNHISNLSRSSLQFFTLSQRCIPCKFLPLCYGGCSFEKHKGNNYCLISEDMVLHLLGIALRPYTETNINANKK